MAIGLTIDGFCRFDSTIATKLCWRMPEKRGFLPGWHGPGFSRPAYFRYDVNNPLLDT
jgi:hypothetical protein